MSDKYRKSWATVSEYDQEELSPKEKLQIVMDTFKDDTADWFDAKLIAQVKVVDAELGKAVFEFTVTPEMCNASGTMHGGCAATLMDNLTSMPGVTLARPGFLDLGAVSRTITCTYLRALTPGQKVKVVCEAVTVGKTMCHFRGDMITEDGVVAVSCTHDKVSRGRSSKM